MSPLMERTLLVAAVLGCLQGKRKIFIIIIINLASEIYVSLLKVLKY